MPKKPKFRPGITRVKLNPEQAVLTCECWSTGRYLGAPQRGTAFAPVCDQNMSSAQHTYNCPGTTLTYEGYRKPANLLSS